MECFALEAQLQLRLEMKTFRRREVNKRVDPGPKFYSLSHDRPTILKLDSGARLSQLKELYFFSLVYQMQLRYKVSALAFPRIEPRI